jgi:hypothetical protein
MFKLGAKLLQVHTNTRFRNILIHSTGMQRIQHINHSINGSVAKRINIATNSYYKQATADYSRCLLHGCKVRLMDCKMQSKNA